MPKVQTPASALKSLMEEYQLNPFSLSKKIGLSTSAVRQIAIGESGITVPTALRLAKFFGQSPAFWLDLQLQVDMQAAAECKELQGALKGIAKAAKPSTQVKAVAKAAAKPAAAKAGAKPTAKKPAAKPAAKKPIAKK